MRLSIGNLQKKILAGPQNALKSVFKVSQPVQAGYLVSQTFLCVLYIASLPPLAGKLQTHFSRAFWGPTKIFFGGYLQRLTLKDFTKRTSNSLTCSHVLKMKYHPQ